MSADSLSKWWAGADRVKEFRGDLKFGEPLSKHTTYRIGGPASLLAIPKARGDLELLSSCARETGVPLFVLGAGSNVLAADEGFPGIVVKTMRMNLALEEESRAGGEGAFRAGASVSISTLLNRAAAAGWGGLEFLSGIPGTVGGIVFMNGGTHLGETSGALLGAEVFRFGSGVWRRIERAELSYSYRENHFLEADDLVWEARFRFRPEDPARVKAIVDEVLARRKATQPLDAPSCGSVFRNPEGGMRAWEVIEKLGLRGHRVGGAQISEKHPNWILNAGGARASDVRALIELAKARARDELGIELREEVRVLSS